MEEVARAALLVPAAAEHAKPGPRTPVPTNYDYDDAPRDRDYDELDLGSIPPGRVTAKTALVARHAITAARSRDCRKVHGSLDLLGDLDAIVFVHVVRMPDFDACLRPR